MLSPDSPQSSVATFSATGRSTAFSKARAHSARVRFVKRALPLLLVAALVVMIGSALVGRLRSEMELPFEIGSLRMSGAQLTMEAPRLSGFTDDGRAYQVNASTAVQDLGQSDVLDLTDVSARLELAEKGWATVASAKGSVDTKRQVIHLTDGVDVATNAGYVGRMRAAEVDVKAGTLKTEDPVALTYRSGKLVADRMTMTDRGSRALFEGHVRVDFRMSDMSRQEGSASPAPAGPVSPSPPAAGSKR